MPSLTPRPGPTVTVDDGHGPEPSLSRRLSLGYFITAARRLGPRPSPAGGLAARRPAVGAAAAAAAARVLSGHWPPATVQPVVGPSRRPVLA